MSISIVATGDSLLTQRLPRNDEACLTLKQYMEDKDVRFTNFELQVHDFEVSPSAVSGGTWVAARPPVIKDLNWLGFNMYACATNHALDWGQDGLLTTLRHLDEAECIHAGAGHNLAEACQPQYLDVPEGRAALISVCSTGKDWHMAGEQRPDTLGRPGINMLRFQTIHYLPEEDIAQLKKIIAKTDVNARRMQLEKEGFAKPEAGFAIGNIRFEPGDAGTVTTYNERDAARILKAIQEAKRQADVVLLSHHVHEFKGSKKNASADFTRDFAHFCIDRGVDAYLGHGPHILRGIEIYKNQPIFYSLGDFIIQNDSVERQPADFYDIYGLGSLNTPSDGFDARSHNGTTGLAANQKVFESVMVSFNVTAGRIDKVDIVPLSLGFEKQRSRKGRPMIAEPAHGEKILQDLQSLSAEYHTNIQVENGRGSIDLH